MPNIAFSKSHLQGPRGMPGERGRPGPSGAPVSITTKRIIEVHKQKHINLNITSSAECYH